MCGISIHAPAKGATPSVDGAFFVVSYFNPRSREGSDQNTPPEHPPTLHFNPRSREGSDVLTSLSLCVLCDISIHAPAKGATFRVCVISALVWNFNPRSREGSDIAALFVRFFRDNFNPRSREGSDGIRPDIAGRGRNISIHAPAKGATLLPCGVSLSRYRFQSTLPRRERQYTRYQFLPP